MLALVVCLKLFGAQLKQRKIALQPGSQWLSLPGFLSQDFKIFPSPFDGTMLKMLQGHERERDKTATLGWVGEGPCFQRLQGLVQCCTVKTCQDQTASRCAFCHFPLFLKNCPCFSNKTRYLFTLSILYTYPTLFDYIQFISIHFLVGLPPWWRRPPFFGWHGSRKKGAWRQNKKYAILCMQRAPIYEPSRRGSFARFGAVLGGESWRRGVAGEAEVTEERRLHVAFKSLACKDWSRRRHTTAGLQRPATSLQNARSHRNSMAMRDGCLRRAAGRGSFAVKRILQTPGCMCSMWTFPYCHVTPQGGARATLPSQKVLTAPPLWLKLSLPLTSCMVSGALGGT